MLNRDSQLPNGWHLRYLPEVFEFLPGKAHEPFVSQAGEFVVANSKFVSTQGSVRKYSTKNLSPALPGDILMVMSDLPNGRALARTYLVGDGEEIAVNQRVCALRVKEGDPQFFALQLDRNRYFLDFDDGLNQTHLLNPVFEKCPLVVPPLPEQRKIAEILRAWDEAIEKLEALREAKRRRNRQLAEDLLFGRRRVSDMRRNWPERRLGDVTREITTRNGDEVLGRGAVMGVTKADGIVPMREQTIGSDLSRYKILPPGAFAYNPMRINVGSLAMSYEEGDVLVSPDYVLFECRAGELDADYFDHLRRTHYWRHHVNTGGSGGVRVRIYYDDLAAMRLALPAYDEQLEIVSILNAARDEIRMTEREIEALQRQKRGLMQKLLTGEWRVSTR